MVIVQTLAHRDSVRLNRYRALRRDAAVVARFDYATHSDNGNDKTNGNDKISDNGNDNASHWTTNNSPH